MDIFLKRATWISCALLAFVSCTSSPELIQNRLEEICESDLNDIVTELHQEGKGPLVAEKPRYLIDTLEIFQGDSALIYQAYAKVYFFYLKNVKLCQVRQYRFLTTSRTWDRFEVKLIHIPPRFREKSGT